MKRFRTPAEVESAFYQAFQELDLELMGQVWTEAVDAACVHPGGDLLTGGPAVIQSWAEVFHAAHRPSLVHRTLQVHEADDLSVHLVEEMIRPGDQPGTEPARVLATNVFRLEAGGWRLLAHHSSLPVIAARRREQAARMH